MCDEGVALKGKSAVTTFRIATRSFEVFSPLWRHVQNLSHATYYWTLFLTCTWSAPGLLCETVPDRNRRLVCHYFMIPWVFTFFIILGWAPPMGGRVVFAPFLKGRVATKTVVIPLYDLNDLFPGCIIWLNSLSKANLLWLLTKQNWNNSYPKKENFDQSLLPQFEEFVNQFIIFHSGR